MSMNADQKFAGRHWITTTEATQLLGGVLNNRQLHWLARTGKVTAMRLPGRTLFDADELVAYAHSRIFAGKGGPR